MRKARPWLGLILGMLLGLMIAVVVQQEGIWPLDQLMVFGMLGLFGLFGTWLGRAGRDAASGFSMIVPLLLAVVLLVVGAFGAGAAGQTGELNGPCLVTAQSSVPDETDVVNTSKSDPFLIDPDGSLSWQAVSDPPITDHHWEIWVGFAGLEIPIADGSHANEGESAGNQDTIEDLHGYIEEVTDVSGRPISGVFEVGGWIANDTTDICDGFAFVALTTDAPFESLVSKVALGLAVLFLLLLLVIFFRRHGGDSDVDFTGSQEVADGAGSAAATGGAGAMTVDEEGPGAEATAEETPTEPESEGGMVDDDGTGAGPGESPPPEDPS